MEKWETRADNAESYSDPISTQMKLNVSCFEIL